MNKTAMQELIDLLKIEANFTSDNDSQLDRFWRSGLRQSIEIANKLIEKEKEQIINTYKDCQDNVLKMIMEKIKFPQAEEYYNQTYNQNK
jgi:hypothetical protein